MTELNIYTKKYVLFLDVLGSKAYTTSDAKSEEFARKVLPIFKKPLHQSDLKNPLRDYQSPIQYKLSDFKKEFALQISQFSDTFVISCNSPEIITIIALIIQNKLFTNELLSRGAITYGKVFHNGSQFIGPAINRAYELEKSYAIYPRIIIDDCINNIVIDETTTPPIKEDVDGWNYVKPFFDNEAEQSFHKLHEEAKQEESYWKVRAKYLWLENKYFKKKP